MSKSDEVVARFMRRAEKLRSIASNVKDRDIRDAMLVWAADYDRLAERAIQLPSAIATKNRSRELPSPEFARPFLRANAQVIWFTVKTAGAPQHGGGVRSEGGLS